MATETEKHSPGPLRLAVFTKQRNGSLSGPGIELRDADTQGTLFDARWNGRMEREGLAVAERVALAFNTHDDLLAAAEMVAEMADGRCVSCNCEIAAEGYCGCEPLVDIAIHERRCRLRYAIACARGGAA